MCGRLNVTDDPAVRALCEELGVDLGYETQRFSRYFGAASKISIIREEAGQRRMQDALWWLLLEQTESGFKPSKYTSINTRYDSLNNPRKAGYRPYRQSRILIPVKGFGESQYANGKLLHCHDMQAKDGAMLLAGLSKQWRHSITGEWLQSCSIITLPPHPKLTDIHSKSMPMIMPQDQALIDRWLNPKETDVSQFEPLLQPYLPITLIAQQIAKPSKYEQTVGEPFVIESDCNA